MRFGMLVRDVSGTWTAHRPRLALPYDFGVCK